MAKIGKESFRIDGEYREFEVHYSRKDGFILKGFPSDVWKFMPETARMPHCSSEGKLIESANIALHYYHEYEKSKKKVILVNLLMGSDYLMNKTGPGSYVGNKDGITREFARKVSTNSGFGRVGARGISFDYSLAYLIEKNGFNFYNIMPDGKVGQQKSGFEPEKLIWMEWTEDREAFMVSVNESFNLLATKLITFFSKPEEELIKAIEQTVQMVKALPEAKNKQLF